MLYFTAFLVACAFIAFDSAQAKNHTHSTVHSGCFEYFLNKDHCVSASDDAPCKGTVGPAYTSHGDKVHKLRSHLKGYHVRRYDSTQKVDYVASGTGICGKYQTEDQEGACLWSGPLGSDGTKAKNSGWLDDGLKHACGQQLYIQRQGQPDTVTYAPVLDGCNFKTTDPAVGCFQIYLTEKTFDLFASDQEKKQGYLDGHMTWDFNNLHHDKPENSPI